MPSSMSLSLQGESINRENAVVMIPRSNTAEQGTMETDGTDGTDGAWPLDFNNMMKAIPKGGVQRHKIKTRDWKSSVAVYNDL